MTIVDSATEAPTVPKADVTFDRLWRVRPLFTEVGAAITELYSLGFFVSLDEAMVKQRGKCVSCRFDCIRVHVLRASAAPLISHLRLLMS